MYITSYMNMYFNEKEKENGLGERLGLGRGCCQRLNHSLGARMIACGVSLPLAQRAQLAGWLLAAPAY